MKKEELRLGNWFYLPNGNVGKISYHELRLMTVALEKPNYNAIPLTEEWLSKFGFDSGFSSDPQEPNASKVHRVRGIEIHQIEEKEQRF